MIIREDLRRPMVLAAASKHGLNPAMVAAFCAVESSWDSHAINPEPNYCYLVDVRTGAPFRELTAAELMSESPPPDFPAFAGVPADAEWQLQQVSLGLLQCMGARARELGFLGRFLTELCEPTIGLEFGCRNLAVWSRRYATIEEIAAAHNSGKARRNADGVYVTAKGKSIQPYVDKIAAANTRYEREWR